MIRKVALAVLNTSCAFLAIVIISACADSTREEATGRGQIRGINAVVDSPELSFLIEEVPIGDSLAYKAAAGFADYDGLTYNFNFDQVLATGATTRVASQSINVGADTEYTVVLTGAFANRAVVVWENEIREFADTDTVFEVDFIHHAPTQGALDIYFAPAGIAPVAGQAIGTLANNERIPFQELPGGDYELTVTPANDVSTILFQTSSFTAPMAARITFAIFDTDPSITTDLAVNLIASNGGSTPVFDVNSPSRLRLLHAALGTVSVDGFLNDDFTSVAYPNIGFGQLSSYAESNLATLPTTVTPVGNVGAPILSRDVQIVANTSRTLILGGAPATPVFFELSDDARPIAASPSIRITNMAANLTAVNVYLLEVGTPIAADSVFLFANVPFPFSTGFFPPAVGSLEMTVTAAESLVPISVPLPVNFQNGDVVDIVIVDTVDPTSVELLVL